MKMNCNVIYLSVGVISVNKGKNELIKDIF